MSLLSVAVSGDVERFQREEIDLKRKADLYVLEVTSLDLQDSLAKRTGETLGARMARTWRRKLYKNPKNPAAMVYSRAPDIISTFLSQTVTLPRKGRYLAVPTGFNRVGGQRGSKIRVTPKQMIDSGQSFTRKAKNHDGLIWFLTVNKASTRSNKGRVKDLAFAGGLVQVGRTGRRTRDILKARAVPMFVLLKKATHLQMIDADGILRRVADNSDRYYAEAFEIFDTGNAA